MLKQVSTQTWIDFDKIIFMQIYDDAHIEKLKFITVTDIEHIIDTLTPEDIKNIHDAYSMYAAQSQDKDIEVSK